MYWLVVLNTRIIEMQYASAIDIDMGAERVMGIFSASKLHAFVTSVYLRCTKETYAASVHK